MGLLMSTVAVASESFPPKSKFTVDDIPDLSDKVIIVTGANCGLGFDTAKVSSARVFHLNAHANRKLQ
jgi:retinol dehydrogenase 12